MLAIELRPPSDMPPRGQKYTHAMGPFAWQGPGEMRPRYIDLSSGAGFKLDRQGSDPPLGFVWPNPNRWFDTCRDERNVQKLVRCMQIYEAEQDLVIIRRSPRWLVHELTMQIMHMAASPPSLNDIDAAGWACRALAECVKGWYLRGADAGALDDEAWGNAAGALLEEVAVIVEREQFQWFPLMANTLEDPDPDQGRGVNDYLDFGPDLMQKGLRDAVMSGPRRIYVWVNTCSSLHDIEDTLGDGDTGHRALGGFGAMFTPSVREEWVMRDDIIENVRDTRDRADLDTIIDIVFNGEEEVAVRPGQRLSILDKETHGGLGW